MRTPLLLSHALLFTTGSLLLCHSPLRAEETSPPVKYPYLEDDGDPEPSADAPPGWEIHILKNTKIQSPKVLRNQLKIRVSLEGYEIAPIPKPNTFVFNEPGFDPQLGTNQKKTLLSILNQSIEQVQTTKTEIDSYIKQLETALATLPTLGNSPSTPKNPSTSTPALSNSNPTSSTSKPSDNPTNSKPPASKP